MKNIAVLLIILLSLTAVSFASPIAPPTEIKPIVFDTNTESTPLKTVGIFLEAPPTYVNNETVQKILPEKTASLFPKNQFKVLPFDTTSMCLRTYKEDNRMIVNQYYSQPVNRSDIQKIAKELNCNYALFVQVANSAPRVGAGLFSVSFRTTVTVDVRLLNVESGQYLISKQIVKDGQSTAIYMGIPSFENAYNEALEKALNDLTIDTKSL